MKIRIEFEVEVSDMIIVEAGDLDQAILDVREALDDVLSFGLPFNYKINKTDIKNMASMFIDTHEHMIVE